MAELRARVRAVRASLSATDLATRVGLDVSFVFWVLEFTAITKILGHYFVKFVLTLGTAPSEKDFIFILVPIDI
jgi:hypothetical protein